jgi:hypothetical protein
VKKDTRYKRINPGPSVEKRELRALEISLIPYVVKNYKTK